MPALAGAWQTPQARRLRAEGIDPLEQRRTRRSAAQVEAARSVTFAEAAERFIASHEVKWRNAKHRYQWRATIATYANPIIGALPVRDIDTGMVMKALTPIWTTKAETASRLSSPKISARLHRSTEGRHSQSVARSTKCVVSSRGPSFPAADRGAQIMA